MSYQLPSDSEIRNRIWKTENDQMRHGYMADYLFLGRVSEVFGAYSIPKGNVFLVDVNGEEAVLFGVHTAKRKGKIRPVLLPLAKKYEPWTEPVYEYITNSAEEYPFLLHQNRATSKTYAMTHARKMFDGLYWPMIDYSRTSKRKYTPDMVKTTKYGDDGYERKLVIFPDGVRAWTRDDEYVNLSVKVESRWKRCTSHVCRKRRTLTLTMDYAFGGIDLSVIGGWTNSSQEQNMPQAIKHYLFLDIKEASENVGLLKNLAMRYFPKLLIERNS